MIHLDALTKQFGKADRPALDAITATIRPGRITGLVGPDGAGKTTLLRLVAGLLEPTSGRVGAFGFDATAQTSEVREFLGYMPQKFGLYEDLTVMENLILYAKLRGLSKKERTKRFDELLEFTGLARFTDRLARRLSGGMKQKLGLACSLITVPRLLLLDEPGVGVDPISRRELWRMVHELLTDETVVVWSTAYLDEAEKCDETLLLNEGQLLFAGPPDKLTDTMKDRVIQVRGLAESVRRKTLIQLIQEQEIIDGTLQGSALRLTLTRPVQKGECVGGYPAVPVAPRFEDGFIERLGGITKGESGLARRSGTISDSKEPVVQAKGLTKRFGSFTAAGNIDFSIRRGEIFGLLGPNGAGKSTTFKMLCGLLRPTSGEGSIAGRDLRRSPGDARRCLGYMAQKFSLYSDLTVQQNLNFFAGICGLNWRTRSRAVEEMLDLFDLGQYRSESAGLLPLGFRQRLSLACALVHSPEVLFLDEPTSGVDPLTRREFWGHINALVEKGVAILVTTHFMDEAEYCDRIALINQGQKIAEGTPDELKRSAVTDMNPDPTLEDAFIYLIEKTSNNSHLENGQ